MRRTTLYDDGSPLLPHVGFENIALLHRVPHPPPKLSTFIHSSSRLNRCLQECRRSGYRSNPVRLPIGVAPSEDDLEAFELELGLAAAMRESPADWAAVA